MSPDYHALCRRLATLCRHLLPPISPTGTYTAEELDRTRGLIALAHAEIEAFIEKRCLEVATEAKRNWVTHRIPNRILFALYTMCYSGWSELDGEVKELSKVTKEFNLEARVGSALSQYQQVVDSNHGVKKTDLRKLLVPLSVRMSDLDPTWILNMSNFGGFRGQIVHMSWKANQPPDPAYVRELLGKTILPGLKKVDFELSDVLTALPAPIQKKRLRERLLSALHMLRTGHFT